MIDVSGLTVSFGSQTLFENVHISFTSGNCYGLIGANGAGKSTFLKVLSGEIEPTHGHVAIEEGKRMAVLRQDLFAYDEFSVLEAVIMGHRTLYEVYSERDRLYSKDDMTDEEGMRVAELEELFGEMDGYTAESDAATMLNELGIDEDFHQKKMSELEAGLKIRVLLAQVLFGEPDIVLLDEPTNQLDYATVLWLENYLLDFQNTVIVVSHDRHFLNKVCTHTADVDFQKIKIYPGNYDFWKQSSELVTTQLQDKRKKDLAKVQELEDFVRRFSANASKSKQATSRKKLIEKLKPEDLPTSTRRSPFIQFKFNQSIGSKILMVDNVTHSVDGECVLRNVTFTLNKGDKLAILGKNSVSKTTFLKLLAGEIQPDEGSIVWGETIKKSYFPKDNNVFFSDANALIEWLAEYDEQLDLQTLRGFLGRMLFSGDDAKKSVNVLSGGERARAMFSKIMVEEPNTILFDEPTDHLDLEAISALNDGLVQFNGCLMFTSHDYQLLNTVANRVIEVSPKGSLEYKSSFHDYMENDSLTSKRERLY